MRLCCLAIFLFTLGILHAKQPLKAPNQTLNQIDEAFITPQEYGQNLYIYPRSIGCIKCHGKYGEEVLLTSYTHKNKKRTSSCLESIILTLRHSKMCLAKTKA
ncbi:hypothetical protein [Helicobacter fennelliae]|uniref:Periplasmic protein n=1 Tax=Helicobacter fennelliae MRY12-0050 TaxID=1325130 RepID=T1D4F9_9HELI|nr:hypothetical protein HFN_1335 [Helicobacter fennelliae MRY12-0050]